MNCDLAFDCLTDATRRDAPELAAHLATCPRCRDMADALEPALDLFGETMSALSAFDELALPIADDTEPLRRTSSIVDRRIAPTELPSDTAWPDAPWHTEARRRLQRRLVTWQILAGVAGLSCVLGALTFLQRSDQSPLLAQQRDQKCQRAELTTASASTVVAGCVACHTLEETLQLIATSRRQDAQETVTRCVACHVTAPKTEQPLGAPLHASAESALPNRGLLACEFLRVGG
ncbi:hypothetical protein GC176_03860 [bacterium]|nr:hypothetical protein [bacterium]